MTRKKCLAPFSREKGETAFPRPAPARGAARREKIEGAKRDFSPKNNPLPVRPRPGFWDWREPYNHGFTQSSMKTPALKYAQPDKEKIPSKTPPASWIEFNNGSRIYVIILIYETGVCQEKRWWEGLTAPRPDRAGPVFFAHVFHPGEPFFQPNKNSPARMARG